MSGLTAGIISFSLLLIALGVIWQKAVKPIIDGLGEIVETIRGIKALIEPDDEGHTLPQRMSNLEAAMAAFLERLAPMVEAIALLASRTVPRPGGPR